MNCAQIKEQLVDFLYDELPASLRAAFAEHLRGCPGCSAEVATYQKTLGQARAALAGPLAQEPPARVRLAVLEAARTAARSARKAEEPGFFARFWRTPWLLPAFGAVSVATVVFLVRVLKNPEVVPGQQPQSSEERAPATPQPIAQPPAAQPAAAAKGDDKEVGAAGIGRVAKASAHKGKAAGGMMASKAEGPAPVSVRKRKDLGFDPLSGSLRGNATAGGPAPTRFAEPPPPRAAAKASREIDDLMGSFDTGKKAAPPAPTETKQPTAKKSSGGREEGTLSLDEFAGAPEPAAQAARPSAPSYAPAGAAAAPAPQPATRPAVRRQAEVADEEATEAANEPSFDAKAKEKADKGGSKDAPSLDESIRKADRLFAAADWNAAAAAYRDLLRRFGSHKDAPKWRDRMNQSLVAEEESRKVKTPKATKAAKAKTTDELLQGDK
jgi:anti-sigma factor RsiW